MYKQEKEFANQLSAFEAMLGASSSDHVENASKAYSFDFNNDKPFRASASEKVSSEPDSPFSWIEEENNCEYYKPTVKLEIKKRMSI